MHRRALLLVFTLAAFVAGPAHVRAQQDCDFTGTQSIRGAGSVIYLTVARLTCTDMRIRADSATLYQDSRTYYLFGRVVIDNPEVHLEAREAQYYPDQGLIQAPGLGEPAAQSRQHVDHRGVSSSCSTGPVCSAGRKTRSRSRGDVPTR